jgi:hypothetical protein
VLTFRKVEETAMRISSFVAVGLATLVAAQSRPAKACGGCFVQPTTVSSAADSLVSGHRMAFAMSENRTVLWDQIQFTGSPSEFGWVLPIKPGAYIEESTDAWFEALETVTKVRVASPQVTCPPPAMGAFPSGSGRGCGCSSDESATVAPSSAGGGFIQPTPPPVTVVHQGTVGPFETVTLHSTDGSKLRQWLTDHGYAVPGEIELVIDAYVSEGADFIALRLIPGKGVNEMTPVRVVTPSGDPILPLRMVAAGTGSFVDIVLYVIGEGRYGLADLTESTVNLSLLNFDFAKDASNYPKLRDDALAEKNGFGYVTAFATPQAFSTTYVDGNGSPVTFSDTNSNQYTDLTSLYFGQASVNDGRPGGASGGACPQSVVMRLGSNLLVGPHPGDAGVAPSARDGGVRSDAGKTITGPIYSDYSCAGHDDIAAAVTGMRPDRVWLARLEMNLPREALIMDCNVGLASSQTGISSQLKATKATNLPCPGGVLTGGVAASFANSTSTCIWAIGSLFAVVVARRHRRTKH